MHKYITVWIFRQVRRVFPVVARLSAAGASVLAFAVLAALPLCAAELMHRWSFNGDWSDSVGGSQSSATACGTYVSLYGNRVHMGYGGCTHGTGYVLNGAGGDSAVLDFAGETAAAEVFDTFGKQTGTLTLHRGIQRVAMPISGCLRIASPAAK